MYDNEVVQVEKLFEPMSPCKEFIMLFGLGTACNERARPCLEETIQNWISRGHCEVALGPGSLRTWMSLEWHGVSEMIHGGVVFMD